ncbi:MAG: hypothetical protein P8X79_16190 [Reinekea sp.]
MIPLCFPKIGVNLWVHLQFLRNKWKSSSYTLHPLWSHGLRNISMRNIIE